MNIHKRIPWHRLNNHISSYLVTIVKHNLSAFKIDFRCTYTIHHLICYSFRHAKPQLPISIRPWVVKLCMSRLCSIRLMHQA